MADVVDEHRDETNGTLWPRTWRKASGPGPRGTSWCRVCGKANGSAEHTDGVYLWPKGLAHYVCEHGVRPPVSVIRHILSRQAGPYPGRVEQD